MKTRMPIAVYISAAVLLILLGFAIRLHDLGADSMWTDEIATIEIARNGIPAALQATRDHPPFAYLFTAISIQMWGETEFAARLPALLAGVLTIPFFLTIGKLFDRPWIGILATIFFVFSPFHIRHSQEVRHYTLLLLTSLASYVFLYKGMMKPKYIHWVLYAAATAAMLYTHYGGFIVLATQLLLIAIWLSTQLYKRNYGVFSHIMAAFLLIPLLYLPWIPRFVEALTYNTNDEILKGTGTATTIVSWGLEAIGAFGMYYSWRPWLFFILACFGLFYWVRNNRWQSTAFIILGLLLPLSLIQIIDVSRGAYARYIIYGLPFYLLLAAATLVAILRRVTKNKPKPFFASIIGVALIFGITSVEPLLSEYQYIQSDWKGIVHHFSENASEDDIVLGLALSHPNGFNSIYHALPYYLKRSSLDFVLMQKDAFQQERLTTLIDEEINVYAIISNWDTPTQFEDPSLKITHFSNHLYVIEETDPQGSPVDRMIHYYEQILTLAYYQTVRCKLYRNLSALEAARGGYLAANKWLTVSRNECASFSDQLTFGVREDTKEAIFSGLFNQMLSASKEGDVEQARGLADILLPSDPKNPQVLDIITAVNLQHQFEQGEVEINQQNAPEPIAIRQFTMPDTGDSGEVLFIHPPASAVFTLTLPNEPVRFSSRVALAPESWAWGGDGVTFILRLETAEGETIELLRQHIENSPANHTWHPIDIPLSQYAGQTITLTLTTETGPAGDGTGDWAGWETPRLMYMVD